MRKFLSKISGKLKGKYESKKFYNFNQIWRKFFENNENILSITWKTYTEIIETIIVKNYSTNFTKIFMRRQKYFGRLYDNFKEFFSQNILQSKKTNFRQNKKNKTIIFKGNLKKNGRFRTNYTNVLISSGKILKKF